MVHFRLSRRKKHNKTLPEDLRYLQQKISGRSVYKKISKLYSRKAKHKKLQYGYTD